MSIIYAFAIIFHPLHVLSQDQSPNILWITCEDIGPAWGCYGDRQAHTPNIDALARQGIIFTQAFSNAPICAPARSTLITGRYAPSLGTQHLRSEIRVPDDLKILPQLLKEKNYFTTNNAKTDYNFSASGRWDENGSEAHWRHRKPDQPFFSVFNFGITHEGHANTYKPEVIVSLDFKQHPDSMELPPYWPQTDTFRHILAHQYDLISVFDQEVKKILDQLDEDGLAESTIVFIFSDHGFGLPRGKRWLYDSGLHVPLVLYIPETFKHRYPRILSDRMSDLIGFVDFAPTVLEMADLSPDPNFQGHSFLSGKPNEFIFGYRDRADDVYDMSRSVYDGRYMYIRNFIPHRPYIQDALIFNKGKRSYEELWQLRANEKLSPEIKKMFERKPVEEFYDLLADPFQTHNIVHDPMQQTRVQRFKEQLRRTMISIYDTGLLNEGEMMTRSDGQSVWEWMRSPAGPDMPRLFEAANLVGRASDQKASELITSTSSEIRHWGLIAADAIDQPSAQLREAIEHCLTDSSFSNRVLAAEICLKISPHFESQKVMAQALRTKNEVLLLQAAISARHVGPAAKPLVQMIQDEIYPSIAGEIWGRYKNWMYPMFIGMALDQVMANCDVSNGQ